MMTLYGGADGELEIKDFIKESGYMRVITGTARGRRLETPVGNDVRPTTDAVKESVFSIIQFNIEGRTFLDGFAGSGQMGIEALSRGAKRAVFIDQMKQSVQIIKNNLNKTGLSDRATVLPTDTIAFLASTSEKFDIVFFDPPYRTGILQSALENVPRVMNKGGIIICEHPTDEQLPTETGDFAVKKHYKYGKIMITVYSHKEVDGI
ncbi:MAG: 16S rRNA (guanine(966)-N(2))-methyltransferase RsmD [Clostridia bacterium]|nr:16S rRNA (guanine(966)-N(2))-methyltransferase RsmD [Clostridia bacterium]